MTAVYDESCKIRKFILEIIRVFLWETKKEAIHNNHDLPFSYNSGRQLEFSISVFSLKMKIMSSSVP